MSDPRAATPQSMPIARLVLPMENVLGVRFSSSAYQEHLGGTATRNTYTTCFRIARQTAESKLLGMPNIGC